QQSENALLGDLDTLRFLGGDFNRVTAVYSLSQPDRMAAGSVTLTGEGLPEATWTVRGALDVSRTSLSLAFDTGELVLAANGGDATWALSSASKTGRS